MIGPQTSIYSQYLLRTAGGGLLQGLESYWPLTEVSGTRVDVKDGNDLTDNNTVGGVPLGPSGVVADFELSNSESLSKPSPTLPLTTTATWSFWTNFESVATNEIILSKWNYATDGEWVINLDNDGGNKLTLYIADSAIDIGLNRSYYNLVAVTAGQWEHWVWVYDGSLAPTSRIKLYKNGVDVSAGLLFDGTIPTMIRAGSSDLVLGTGSGGLGTRFFDGFMGRAGIWDQAFDSTRVASLYADGVGKNYAALTTADKVGLLSYWNLDEASGNRADSHGSNTLTDNNTVGSATNSYPANMPGTVANFVAANAEYLSHVDTPSLRIGTSVAIAYWLKPNGVGQTAAHVSKAEGSGVNRDYLALTIAGAQAFSGEGSNVDLVTAGTPADGVWTFVYVEKDATSGKCGVSLNNGVLVQSAGSSAATPTDAPFAIGARSSFGGGIDLYYTGQLSGVGLWHRILTTDERTLLYAAGAGLFYPF